MPRFILLLRWTANGHQDIVHVPQRRRKAIDLAQNQFRCSVQSIHHNPGGPQGDVTWIIDAPDGNTAHSLAAAFDSFGYVTTVVTRAFTDAEYDTLIAGVAERLGGYT